MKDMLEKIKSIVKSYNELGVTFSDPGDIQDYNKFKQLSKKRKSMEETVELYHKWQDAEQRLNEASSMIKNESDAEMRSFLQSEIEESQKIIEDSEEKMKLLLLPRDPNDDKDIMLEVRGGAGGGEANIFAGDLMRMYLKYAD